MVAMTPAIAITQWLAFLACVCLGYFLSRPLKPPIRPLIWVLMIAAVFVIGYLPFLMVVIWIFGAPVMVSNLLWGVGIGIVIGLMLRQAQQEKGSAGGSDGPSAGTGKPG